MARPFGSLLSLLALALLCLLCIRWKAPWIEQDITTRTNESLQGEGYTFASAQVDGRDVRLVGTAPTEDLRSAALANARGVWGARVVDDGMTLAAVSETPPVEAEPEPDVAAPAADPDAACRARLADLVASDAVHFAFDRADLSSDARAWLDRVAGAAADCGSVRLDLQGNTDSQGSDGYNDALSRRRVTAVRDYLVAAGLSAARLQTEAFGEREPVDTNATAAGRAANRRVEIHLIGATP